MRKFTTSSALLALCLAAPAFAGDFDALLGEINFDGADSIETVESKSEVTLGMPKLQAPSPLQLVPAEPKFAAPSPDFAAKTVSTGSDVNFQQVFQQQASSPTDVAMIACDTPSCDSGYTANCGCGAGGNCGEAILCAPHQAPNLPSSTILQYFRSNRCYTNIWDGYQAERAHECCKFHEHLHGNCDCFAPKQRKKLFHGKSFCGGSDSCAGEPACAAPCTEPCAPEPTCAAPCGPAPCDAPSCDAPGCDS